MIIFLAGLTSLVAAWDLTPALETYLWGEERLAGFLQGSKEYYHYELLDLLHQGRANSSEFDNLMKKYEAFGESEDYLTLKVRSLLKKWDTAVDLNSRGKILQAIRRHLEQHYYAGAQRPASRGHARELPTTLPALDLGIPSSVYTSVWDFQQLPQAAYALLNLDKMSREVFKAFLSKGVVPEIEKIPEVASTKITLDEIAPYFAEMTVNQLEEYAYLRPDARSHCSFADALLRKKHPVATEDYETIQKVLRAAHEANHSCKLIEKQVVLKLLVLGLYTNNLSESEFQRYLTLRKEVGSSGVNSEYIMRISIPEVAEHTVIGEYEDYFLAKEDPEYSHYRNWYLNIASFRDKIARSALLAGESCSDTQLSSTFEASLAATRELEFERRNRQRFTIEDGVTLQIRRKHIPKVILKVISIDAQRYYRTNIAPIPSDLPLDGVEGMLEKVLENPSNPLLRLTETVSFPELRGMEGLFVVEAMGAGRHARVWIQKGELERVTVNTEEGYRVYIYTNDGQIRVGEQTGLMLDGKKYRQEEGKDYVLIPWPDETVSKTLVLFSGNIAQYVGSVTLTPPKYALKAGYHLETEAFRPKQRTFAVITPQLFFFGQVSPLSSLSHLHAKVTVYEGDEQGIVVGERAIEGTAGTISVPFELPEEFSSLEISLSAVLKSNPEVTFLTSKTVDLDGKHDIIADLYLRKTAEEYQIHVLGKNGEERSDFEVDITASSLYSSQIIKSNLQSDKNGIIHLGKLTNVKTITANIWPITRAWDLERLNMRVSYPKVLSIATSDHVQVPVVGSGPVSLLFKAGNTVVSSAQLPIDPVTSTVTIQSLAPGDYQLRLPYGNQRVFIAIKVLAGTLLTHRHVLTATSITSLTQTLPLAISTLEIRRKSVKIQLSGHCQDARLTISLRQFVGTEVDHWAEFEAMRVEDYATYPTAENKAKYMESRLLDEEYMYIMDRKHAKDKRGISFPQPSLLARPALVGGTVTEEQIPHEGTAFKRTAANSARSQDRFYARNLADSVSTNSPFLDFLAEPAMVITNLIVDQNCSATIGISDLRKYSLVEVMARGNGSVTMRTELVSDAVFEKRPLVVSKVLPAEGGFAEIRTLKVVRKGDETGQIDRENAASIAINTLGKLLEVLRDYQPGLSEWKFLSDWGLKSLSEKLVYYDKYASNELHYFLFHKDFAFFSAHIKPLIQAKFKKTLIDDIVLEKPLGRYMSFPQVQRLSPLDKALLARHEPKLIALLKQQNDANPASITTLKDLFDHVFKDFRKGAILSEGSEGGHHRYKRRATEDVLDGFNVNKDLLLIDPDEIHTVKRDYSNDRASANEYQENQYLTDEDYSVNAGFWAAAAEAKSPFLSELVLFAHNSLREALLAVSVVDLPWTSPASIVFGKADSEGILLKREIQRVDTRLNTGLSVAQFYMKSNTDARELIKHQKYTSKVVLSNLSQQYLTLEVLLQLPEGSISLHHRGSLLFNVVTLSPHSLLSLTYDFYFPSAGVFTHAGVELAQEGVVIQRSQHRNLTVLEEETSVDMESFASVCGTGNITAVLDFLNRKNIHCLDYNPVLWMLENKENFLFLTDFLRNRLIYIPEIWAYSLQHQSDLELREFISSDSAIRRRLGPNFTSSLINTDTDKGDFEYLEYFPMVNPRWHPLQGHSRIANQEFRATYERFLTYLADKQQFELSDRLILAQYLVMQHRYEEAQYHISLIPPLEAAQSDLSMQYEYLSAFLDSSLAYDSLGRYNETVSRFWRGKWQEMGVETAPKQPGYFDTDLMSVELVDSTLSIYSEGLAKCDLKAHIVDLELLFSRSPFLKATAVASSYTSPTFSQSISLVSGFVVKYTIPETYQLAKLMLSLDCGNHLWSGLYSKSALKVQVYSSKGLIRVVNSKLEGVPSAYVKVYSKDSTERVDFYKDGYTDSNGKFDYSTITSDKRSKITAFSVLVTHETLGAAVVEVGT